MVLVILAPIVTLCTTLCSQVLNRSIHQIDHQRGAFGSFAWRCHVLEPFAGIRALLEVVRMKPILAQAVERQYQAPNTANRFLASCQCPGSNVFVSADEASERIDLFSGRDGDFEGVVAVEYGDGLAADLLGGLSESVICALGDERVLHMVVRLVLGSAEWVRFRVGQGFRLFEQAAGFARHLSLHSQRWSRLLSTRACWRKKLPSDTCSFRIRLDERLVVRKSLLLRISEYGM